MASLLYFIGANFNGFYNGSILIDKINEITILKKILFLNFTKEFPHMSIDILKDIVSNNNVKVYIKQIILDNIADESKILIIKSLLLFILISYILSKIINFIIGIFLYTPLTLGYKRMYLNTFNNKQIKITDIIYYFNKDYLRTITKILIIQLEIFIKYLLFFIPGIIINLKYYFIRYIYIENTDLTAKQIKAKSKKITHGYKKNIFLKNVQFLLLKILVIIISVLLSTCTCMFSIIIGLFILCYIENYKQLYFIVVYKNLWKKVDL